MIEMQGFLWLRPWWLALIPLALILALAAIRRSSSGLGAWERAVDRTLLEAMQRIGRVRPGRARRRWWPAAVLAVLGLALAGPAAERRDTASFRNLDAVLLVLDLSPSVAAGPHFFETITAARLIAQTAGTRQTGLIVYAGEAYLAFPLSTDAAALTGTLALLDPQTLPVEGSRPAEALRLAARVLEGAAILVSDVVLFSDGGGLGPDATAAAAALTRAGAAVSVIRVPGEAQSSVALSALARVGAGAEGTLANPFPVAHRIAARPVERLAQTDYAMLTFEDLGRWLLVLALVPAFLLLPGRRRG